MLTPFNSLYGGEIAAANTESITVILTRTALEPYLGKFRPTPPAR